MTLRSDLVPVEDLFGQKPAQVHNEKVKGHIGLHSTLHGLHRFHKKGLR